MLILKDGRYENSPSSLSFPEIDMAKLVSFLQQGEKDGDVAMMRQVREWAGKQGLAKKKKKSR